MTLLSVRPRVADLIFGLFGRSLHPELFEIHATQRIDRDRFEAKIDLTTTGHVVMFKVDGRVYTEIATCASQPLPEKRRLLTQRLTGRFEDHIECENALHFQYLFDLEPTTPETFKTMKKAFQDRSSSLGVLHQFPPTTPGGIGAMSYMYVETRIRSLRVQAIHTFPDECAILKTQSLFQISEDPTKES